MSIIIIAFPGAPKVCNEAVKQENELNEEIKQKVTGKRCLACSPIDETVINGIFSISRYCQRKRAGT